MKVHHLNCATILLNRGILQGLRQFICHCLLIETNEGLVLVDTGFGSENVRNPNKAFRRAISPFARPKYDESETALRQIENLGFQGKDVRHIVLTHLDLDHCGGLPDFPHAKVHVFGPEYIAAMAPATFVEKLRYTQNNWAHKPDWVVHRVEGESWYEFECVRQLEGLPPEILLVPLTGHTLGHCGVAVRRKDDWLLHAGDAYFHHTEIGRTPRKCPIALQWFEKMLEVDRESRLHNLYRLRELRAEKNDEIKIFCAHDENEYLALKSESSIDSK